MNEKYEIIVDMKTAAGYVECCRFSLGADQEAAKGIFSSLNGTIVDTSSRSGILRMALVHHTALSEVIETRYCTLNELSCNCQTIIKEIFKVLLLE